MRTNIYKQKIIDLLNKHHLLSISQIHKYISEANNSTIFRNIEELLKQGQIRKIIVDDKNTSYELTNHTHDHFICNDCGKIESVKISHNIIKNKKIDNIIIRGNCNDCN
jgi:Fe2+ or Zn2+ uptake regulation protein